jgi:hypothetical protein
MVSRASRRPRVSRVEIIGIVLFSLALIWLGLIAISLAQ